RAEAVSWQTLSRQRPELCDAALRLHHADLLRLPPGARLSEQHRRDPDADDWARLIEDWMRHHLLVSEEPSDRNSPRRSAEHCPRSAADGPATGSHRAAARPTACWRVR